jgi:hypothetical protein
MTSDEYKNDESKIARAGLDLMKDRVTMWKKFAELARKPLGSHGEKAQQGPDDDRQK